MHPNVGSDLARLGQLDHVHRGGAERPGCIAATKLTTGQSFGPVALSSQYQGPAGAMKAKRK